MCYYIDVNVLIYILIKGFEFITIIASSNFSLLYIIAKVMREF